jgi:hypothetical protein
MSSLEPETIDSFEQETIDSFEQFRLLYAQPQPVTAIQEIGSGTPQSWNVEREYMAIQRLVDSRGGYASKFEEGFHKVLKYILNNAYHDPQNGDWWDEKNNRLIRQAGILLHQESAMWDSLLWSFVPDRYRRNINLLWDGIGEWRA